MSASPIDYVYVINLLFKGKKLFCITALSIMTLTTLVCYIIPKQYEAQSTVFIEKNVLNEVVKGLALTAPSIEDSLKVLSSALSSRTLMRKVVADVDFKLRRGNDADIQNLFRLLNNNTVIKVVDKDLFKVTFTYTDPIIARDYVNALVRHYIEGEISSKKSESYDASKFLSEQAAAYKSRIEQIEATVNQYKNTKSSIMNMDTGQIYREIGLAQQKLYDLQLRRRQLEEEKKYLQSATDPVRQKLALLQKRLDDLRVQYTDNYPEVLSIKSQIEVLQEESKHQKIPGSPATDIPQEIWKIDAELKALRENETITQQYINENKQMLNSIPESKNTLERLEAEKSSQKTTYDMLAMRNNQADLSKQMELQDRAPLFRVVDQAVTPAYPVSPNRKKILMLGIVAGLAGGVALLVLLDQFDHSVKLVESLKPLGLPVLAVVPLIRSDDEINALKKNDLRIYIASGVCFLCILGIFFLELLGSTLVDTVFNKLHLPQLFSGLFRA